ncbi:MAG: Lrp/AsnC family transcriptional regulator [Hyphomicrobiales bacterium]|nr:Lrp/AsnC family transcriptional regulator [Hyphomicrobiales bacterium]
MELSTIEKKLVNSWQRGFPLSPRPYALIADELGIRECDVIAFLASLKKRGVLSRVGAVVRPNTAGASSLVAMAVQPEHLEYIAQIVSVQPQVNHNYERENSLNLWFVVTASSDIELEQVLSEIEQRTGYDTIRLPLEKAFHIDLGFTI